MMVDAKRGSSLKDRTRVGRSFRIPKPIWGLGLLLALVCGCGEAAPELETWPVHGKIVDQRGKPVTRGAIRFMTDLDAYLNASGTIEADGSFTMHSNRRGFTYEGAPPGTYQVVVLYEKKGADGKPFPAQYPLPETYTVEPKDNELTVKMRR